MNFLAKYCGITTCIIMSLIPPSASYAGSIGASMSEITDAVGKLCGRTGQTTHFAVKGAGSIGPSKTVSLVVDGRVAGEVEFSKDEWDGVKDIQNHAQNYTSCVEKLSPIFIEKFAGNDYTLRQADVKILDVSLGIKPLRDFCASNPGVPPPVSLMNPPQQVACRNGTADTARPMCLCP